MDNEPINRGEGLESQIVNGPYKELTESTLRDLMNDLSDNDESRVVAVLPTKPKRKYVRKEKPLTEVIKDTSEEDYKKQLEEERTKLKHLYAVGSRGYRGQKGIINYLTFVIKHLNPDIKFDIYLESRDHYNVLGYTVIIQVENPNNIYETYQVSFSLEELHQNCSSVGIHHLNGLLVHAEDKFYLFKKEEDVHKFLDEVVEVCKIFGYTNILYTISSESNKYLSSFVKLRAKEILEFKSKRTQHVITYYSQLI